MNTSYLPHVCIQYPDSGGRSARANFVVALVTVAPGSLIRVAGVTGVVEAPRHLQPELWIRTGVRQRGCVLLSSPPQPSFPEQETEVVMFNVFSHN